VAIGQSADLARCHVSRDGCCRARKIIISGVIAFTCDPRAIA
jgi:hypothetical protein